MSSKRYLDLISKLNFNFLYSNNDRIEDELNNHQLTVYNTVKTAENLIKSFCDSILAYAEEIELLKRNDDFNKEEARQFTWEYKLSPEEIFVKIYGSPRVKESSKSEFVLNNVAKIENRNDLNKSSLDMFENDINLNSFLSNLKFIEDLCVISNLMMNLQPNDQMAYLRREVTDINKCFPANVYLPFLKDSLRNYIVCHIPITELKIFRTKNRAPFMIVVEVIRTDEVISNLLENNAKNNVQLNNSQYMPPSELIKKIRSQSMLNSGEDKLNKSDINLDYSKNRKDTNYSKTFVENKTRRNRALTVDVFSEFDVHISKPVTISKLESENKKKPLRGQNRIIVEENEDLDDSFVKEGVNDYVKRRLTAYQIKSKHILSEDSEIGSNKEKKLEPKNRLEEEPRERFEENIKYTKKDKFRQRARNYTSYESTGKENNLLNFDAWKNNSINKSLGSIDKYDEECKEINFDNTLQENKYGDIFGESMDEQSERIRSSSPFGEFNSWKIFKMISNH